MLGRDPLGGALFVAVAGAGVVWYAAIVRCAREPRALDALLRTFVVSGALASALAIALLAARVPAALYTISHARATGTFVVPGELAGYLIVFIPIAFALARRGGALAPFAWCGLALGTTAFALTFSRAGWAGLTEALAMLAVARRGRLRYAAALAGAAIALLALVFNAHHDPSENFTRLSIWEAALQSIVRFPFSGVGPFGFAHVYPLVRAPGAEPSALHAHGIVLTVAAEAGLLGVAALAWGWWRFAAELRARLTSHGARSDDALQRGDPVTAAAWIARMPPGARRDDRRARSAAVRGDEATAIAFYLDAGNDEALQHLVNERVQRGRLHDADALERRIRDRLAQTPTRPNALGDAWWRLGRLAARLDRPAEAAADLDRASALAPLNTKYLLDAAQLALERGDLGAASSRFMRAAQIDPGDADAVAGAGLVALARGDVGSARATGRRSDRIDPGAPLARRLRERLAAAR
ncbi:hypothetical protein WPS_02480 [Vulcanimicrobium alpinum]|uniref:O-antigen ligase-related domain-containing protein n=1 Tax=Vulcanimicrobium alpinum TaxID=3016050 RepID=A0AAN1XVB0_UNVUL|nr:O-antigen ligase family protein [Vulcanimicrobium alpinum]BDE04972.1 hypothetical protein WPS_02480 [Vulcanimicrobium alpinum]